MVRKNPDFIKADFPKYLQDQFRSRCFSAVNPPELLDREGAEFVMFAAARRCQGIGDRTAR
jgi:hypothetical protein